MNDTMITLTGWLGGDPRVRDVNGVTVANFRVASTPRRFNRDTGQWEDGETQWFSVAAWRTLGEHCAQSLRRGDAVVVYGRLTVENWTTRSGMTSTSFEVEAMTVGHDLTKGTSLFARTTGREPGLGDPTGGDRGRRGTEGTDGSEVVTDGSDGSDGTAGAVDDDAGEPRTAA